MSEATFKGSWSAMATMEDFTVLLREPENIWRQDDGRPGAVDILIYEVTATEVPSGARLYWREGSDSNVDATSDLDEAEPLVEGWMKWDGCFAFDTEDAHCCSAGHLARLFAAITRGHEMAAELLGPEARRALAT